MNDNDNGDKRSPQLEPAANPLDELHRKALATPAVQEALRKLKPIQREILRLKTTGAYTRDIAWGIARTSRAVQYQMEKEPVKEATAIIEHIQDVEVLDQKKKIRELTKKALRVMDNGMDSQNERVAVFCADKMLDRNPDTSSVAASPLAMVTAEGLEMMKNVLTELKNKEDSNGETNNGSKKDAREPQPA